MRREVPGEQGEVAFDVEFGRAGDARLAIDDAREPDEGVAMGQDRLDGLFPQGKVLSMLSPSRWFRGAEGQAGVVPAEAEGWTVRLSAASSSAGIARPRPGSPRRARRTLRWAGRRRLPPTARTRWPRARPRPERVPDGPLDRGDGHVLGGVSAQLAQRARLGFVVGVGAVPCALRCPRSAGVNPPSASASRMARAMPAPCGSGAVMWWASQVDPNPVISARGRARGRARAQ